MNAVNFISLLIFVLSLKSLKCNHDAKRLYDDLLSNYNKLVRPVINTTDVLKVSIKLKLSQLIDVNLKNQIMSTNLWVEQTWNDYKLKWNPQEYGGIKMIHLPADDIWRPDIVLYNNADGNYEVKLMTKANIHYTGRVIWKPPTIYKSFCSIDVEFFPYDVQTCVLKLGSWTYDGFQVDLRHMDELNGQNIIEVGIDLSEYYMSVEWDILEVPAVRNEKFYTCCDEPYLDITFNITMRRKTLFYTVNIIIPCMGISFLTILTFYLPSDSGEKVTLSISILISLHVFFLLVVEIIPPTSIVVPLLGKYLIFAMILVSLSICVTVAVLNLHFRSPQTCEMPTWIRKVFIEILPRFLFMKRPKSLIDDKIEQTTEDFIGCQVHSDQNIGKLYSLLANLTSNKKDDEIDMLLKSQSFSHVNCPQGFHATCLRIQFIAEHTKMFEFSTKIKEDWKYVGMVLDRLFLWIFASAVSVGTAVIILQAPSLYDTRDPIDKQFSNYTD